ncbi:helix-turn-helix domain-containing protein [Yoonia sediminilitoris]|uniref:XRE family transcriptional regulator n=1 Tax=Yoonia sediminilitoris TaxID=1286148 RepID=A0A2T6KPH8_9RHOB|nr:XRE family transcriptional regulator [Yoonia sediminilitoris]PUB18476.1 XRE family transcriptional regulator [Yoonia sediminilitoris]RCW98644.1 XRE family transcriptional regulator [Yoonia sediminilitoris]
MSKLQPIQSNTLGADLRALRKARGLTLSDLAAKMGRSVGWISQVERDISVPTFADQQALAALLDVSVSSLAHTGAAQSEDGVIVRRDARRPIGSRMPGLVESLLSPDLTDDFEVVHSAFAPGATSPGPTQRDTTEIGYLVTGRITLWVEEKQFHLGPGDSFRLRGECFRWANPYDDPCEMIWIISPPVY